MDKSLSAYWDQRNTGDVVLFCGMSKLSSVIKFFTGSQWSHVGVVYKRKDGVYILEANKNFGGFSGSAQDGVGITKVSERFKEHTNPVLILSLSQELTDEQKRKFDDFYQKSKNKPFELTFFASYIFPGKREQYDEFFCSELVAALYRHIGLLPKSTRSASVAPSDFLTMKLERPYRFIKPYAYFETLTIKNMYEYYDMDPVSVKL